MGPRTTRAADLVKAIMERDNPVGSSSKPASKKVLRLLQKKGFERVSKCLVGLPAVGKVAGGFETKIQSIGTGNIPENEAVEEVVSRVGRWWYTRCYEGVITNGGEAMRRSMWCDKLLLDECESLETCFRMLVCCARKPLKRDRQDESEAK